jgi:16S rRNA (cytidine1402-2'-O)-methyltransferase
VLLARFDIDTPLVSCHKFNEKARLEPLLQKLAEGRIVALVSDAGTPGIADPGALLVRAAVQAGHEVSPLPGPSAVTALLSVSGFPSDRFLFEGFLPHRAGERRRVLRELSRVDRPLVVYETPHRIREALEDVRQVMGNRPLVLGRELTKIHETILYGTAGELLEALGASPKGEIVLAIAAGDGTSGGEDAAERIRDTWRAELEASDGDRRTALKQTCKLLGMKRAELYRLLAELGEDVDG